MGKSLSEMAVDGPTVRQSWAFPQEYSNSCARLFLPVARLVLGHLASDVASWIFDITGLPPEEHKRIYVCQSLQFM
jgi:hypothetical protein